MRSLTRGISTFAQRVEQLNGLCVANLGAGAAAMARGDLQYEIVTGTPMLEITSIDEVGALEGSVNGIIRQTQATVAAFEEALGTLRGVLDEAAGVLERLVAQDLTRRMQGDYQGDYSAREGVTLNAEVLQNFAELTTQIDRVGEVMAEISAASEQQTQGIDQISGAVGQMNQVTQQTAAAAEESAATAEELSGQSAEMQALVGAYRLTGPVGSGSAAAERAAPAKPEAAVGARVLRPSGPLASGRTNLPAQLLPLRARTALSAGANGHTGGSANGHADPQRVIPFGDEGGDARQTF